MLSPDSNKDSRSIHDTVLRPPPDKVKYFEAPGCSKTEIAEHYGISRSSVYRLYAENRQPPGRKKPSTTKSGAFMSGKERVVRIGNFLSIAI
jgi:hypothetical protein